MSPDTSQAAIEVPSPLLPRLADLLPCPLAVVSAADGRVLAANTAWQALFAADGRAQPGFATLADCFAKAAAAPAEAVRANHALTRHAVAAAIRRDGAATWWDLDFVAHPDASDAVVVTARDVTDSVLARREAEEAREALAATGTRLHLAQEAAGIGTWEWTAHDQRQAWSPQQFRLHGLDPARGAPPDHAEWIAMVNPADRADITATAEQGFRNGLGGAYQSEFRIRRADTGEERWLLALGRVVEALPDGRAARVIGVNLDISERRREQEKLRASEARLRIASQAAHVFAWDWHIASGRVDWVEGLEGALGLAPGGFGGTVKSFREFVLPEDLPAVEEALRRALAGETPQYKAEFRMRRADGSVRWTHTRATVLRDEAGRPVRVVGMDHDITERKAAEAALTERKARLRLALEAAGLAVWETNLATGRNVWDASMARLLGLSADQSTALADKWFDLVHPQDRARVLASFNSAAAGQPSQTTEFRIRRPDGAERTFQSRGILAAPGRVVGYVRDVTKSADAADLLAEGEAHLRAALRAAHAAAWSYDPQTGTGRWSPEMFEIFGLDPADAQPSYQEWLSGCVHPDDRDQVAATFGELSSPGTATTSVHEFRILHGRRGVRWIETHVRVERAPDDGRTLRMAGLSIDVTERREADQQKRRLWQLIQHSSDFIGMSDPDGRLTFMNPSARRMIGVADDADLGQLHFTDYVAPAFHDMFRSVAIPTARDRGMWEGEMQFVHLQTGAPIDVHRCILGQRDKDGTLAGYATITRDITHSNRVAVALAGSEARLQMFIERAPAGIAMFDAEMRFLAVSRRFTRDFGPRPGASTRSQRGRKAAGLPAVWRDAHRRVLRGETLSAEADPIIRDDGRTDWVRWEMTPWRHADGAFGGTALFSEIVTERKQIEAALRGSQAQLQFITDNAAVFLVHFDPSYRFTFVNNRYAERLGSDASQMIGRRIAEVIGNAAFAVIKDHADRALAGERVEFEVEVPYRQIGHRFIHAAYVPDHDEAGQVRGVVGAMTDVTARRQAEQALRRSEAQFRATAEALPGMLFVTAPDGGNTYVNRGYCDFTGRQAEQLLGHGWTEVVHPDDRDRLAATCLEAVRTRAPYVAECRFRRHDSAWRWHIVRALPLDVADEPNEHWVGTCTDIHDRHEAEQELRRLNDELDARVTERTRALSAAARELAAELARNEGVQTALLQAQKMEALGQLTSGVAHDFNNILGAVLGSLELLHRRVLEPKSLNLIERGQEAVLRGAGLIAQLLAFARREEVRPKVLDPAKVLLGAEEMIRHTAGSGAVCVLTIADDTWMVIADQLRLETQLLNLAANARDAMPNGGRVTVSVRNATAAELPPELSHRQHVRIAIADTGVGMDEDTLRRATEPFFTTKPTGKGTGLGLASAHDFASQAGGTLRLRSAPGRGTTVEMFLPRAGIVPHGDTMSASARQAAELDTSLHGGATILLVDDDDNVRSVTAGLLRDLGYSMIEAANANAAEVLAHPEEKIDLLITDVVMPGASGPVLVSHLRASRPNLPVLYATAFRGETTMAAGPVLFKPFTAAELGRAVLDGLGRTGRPGGFASGAGRDNLLERMRSPALRHAYLRWRVLRGGMAAGLLPTVGAFDFNNLSDESCASAYLAEARSGGTDGFRFVRVGRALEERLGRKLTGTIVTAADSGDVTSLLGGSLSAAFRRCSDGRGPLYDYARFTLGTGQPLLFERLLLPLSADGGVSTTHLAGVALFTELSPRTARQDPPKAAIQPAPEPSAGSPAPRN